MVIGAWERAPEGRDLQGEGGYMCLGPGRVRDCVVESPTVPLWPLAANSCGFAWGRGGALEGASARPVRTNKCNPGLRLHTVRNCSIRRSLPRSAGGGGLCRRLGKPGPQPHTQSSRPLSPDRGVCDKESFQVPRLQCGWLLAEGSGHGQWPAHLLQLAGASAGLSNQSRRDLSPHLQARI